MTLKNWASNGWLKTHKTTPTEITDLFEIVDRDLKSAETKDLHADWRFGIAYNAALKLCTILLYASGYRPDKGQSNHYRTIEALPLILTNDQAKKDAAYLDACRTKRNEVEYDAVGGATDADAKELVEFTKEFRKSVVEWLKKNQPFLSKK